MLDRLRTFADNLPRERVMLLVLAVIVWAFGVDQADLGSTVETLVQIGGLVTGGLLTRATVAPVERVRMVRPGTLDEYGNATSGTQTTTWEIVPSGSVQIGRQTE